MLMSLVKEVGWLAEAAGGVSVTMLASFSFLLPLFFLSLDSCCYLTCRWLRGGLFMMVISVVEVHRRYGRRHRRERLVFGLKMKGGSGVEELVVTDEARGASLP